jgi:sterol desaturase/sphingolipid hydroxylase (fatty acid hydroxylase superfamily)
MVQAEAGAVIDFFWDRILGTYRRPDPISPGPVETTQAHLSLQADRGSSTSALGLAS